jgi:regulation of enolase protein 1 (concanavalin A-like superfamily)
VSKSQESFHAVANQLGTDTASPKSYSTASALPSRYTLTARATDDDGAVTTSSPVHVTVSAAGVLPAPWVSQDVGLPGVAGSASHSSGTFMLKGSGTDIWGSSDKFHFVHRPLSGDGEIVARVASIQNTHQWAKAGVMIRASLAANSANAMMLVTPAPANGLRFQHRATAGASSISVPGATVTAPHWVRLVRTGNTLTGFQSPDGTAWTEVGSATIPMAADVFIGLAVTSHKNTTLCTAALDSVLVP